MRRAAFHRSTLVYSSAVGIALRAGPEVVSMTQLAEIFHHRPHIRPRQHMDGTAQPPPKVDDERVGFNGKLGLLITTVVGTMWAAYLFTIIALVSLPSALRSHDSIILAWIAQTFLQLVLLPIIIVGQN